jgi:hypothetical protein
MSANGARATILVAGWFSFEQMGATAGDLIARDVACAWLDEAGRSYDIALAPPFAEGVDWRAVDPAAYSDVVFVCGPFGNGWPLTDFLARFRSSRLVGLNLSLLEPLEAWNPFDFLLERDSSRTSRPDLTFAAPPTSVPVVGVVLVHPQREYKRGLHQEANAAIERLLSSRELARVSIDTRVDENSGGLRTTAEVESLVARMDAVVTTRLHGLVLALKNGVPALAIDPVAGSAKLARQAATLGWPNVFTADALSDEALAEALDRCLSPEGRKAAAQSAARARTMLLATKDEFVAALARSERAGES